MSTSTFQTAAVLKSVFGDALEKYTDVLLAAVCSDYELDYEELSLRYMDGTFLETTKVRKAPKEKAARQPKAEKKPCTGLTSKGGPCKFAALGGSDLCGIHQRKSEGGGPEPKPKPDKVPREKKIKEKKADPRHNHALTEESEDCGLCQTHGNAILPGMPDTEFEAVTSDEVSIKERLKAILASSEEGEESEPVPAPEPEPEPEPPVRMEITPEPEAAPTPEPAQKAEAGPSAPRKSGFIRPKIKSKKAIATPAPEPEPEQVVDEADNIRNRLKAILASAEDDSEDEDDDTMDRLTMKLASKFDEDPDDMDMEQMCDSPTSQSQLREAWADMTLEEEEEE